MAFYCLNTPASEHCCLEGLQSARGIPALLLFLVIGMLAGSDGPGGIYFDDALAAQSVGIAVFIARPVSVLLALLPVKMSFREKLFVS